MYKLFVALRYLKRRIITYIAVAGVSVGVMVLVIVLSVMGGFQREFHEKIRGTMADVIISRENFQMKNHEEIMAKVLEVPGVEAASPFVQNIMLIKGTRIDFGFIKGIDPLREPGVTRLREYLLRPEEVQTIVSYNRLKAQVEEHARLLDALEAYAKARGVSGRELESNPMYNLRVKEGEFLRNDFRRAKEKHDLLSNRAPLSEDEVLVLFCERRSELPGIIVGIELFEHYHMETGCEVALLTAASLDVNEPSQQRFEVLGAFRTGMFENDFRYAYAQLYDVQQFIGVPGAVSGISVKLEDYRKANEVRAAIEKAVDARPFDGTSVLTWEEQNRTLLQAVRMEKWLLGFIIFFIVIVAGFTIVSILAMMVIEKTRDLGILKSLGASSSGVMGIFLVAGSFIGLVGSLVGCSLGLLFVRNINEIAGLIEKVTGYHPFPSNVYYLDKIPALVDPAEIVSVVVPTVMVSFAFALYPAARASRLNPVEALRYE